MQLPCGHCACCYTPTLQLQATTDVNAWFQQLLPFSCCCSLQHAAHAFSCHLQVEKVQPKASQPAYLEVCDIAGLVKGAAEGQGLGNAFLSNIAAVDGERVDYLLEYLLLQVWVWVESVHSCPTSPPWTVSCLWFASRGHAFAGGAHALSSCARLLQAPCDFVYGTSVVRLHCQTLQAWQSLVG